MMWLVRHGQSAWNVASRIQGQSPRAGSLTPAGRDQAELAARQLAGLVPYGQLIVASDLARTAETAAIIAGRLGLPLEFDPSLRELDLGQLEGTSSVEVDGQSGRTADVIDRFWDDPYRRPPGGETVAELYHRIHGALIRLAASWSGADLIVVTHGGPVRVATAASLPPPGSPLPRGPVANASITPWPGPAHTEMVAP
jgi:probable phosphoglycerate mutase